MDFKPEYLRWAKTTAAIMAKRTGYSHAEQNFEDFYSVACEALLDALPRYDPSKGASLETWCSKIMKHRISDYIRVEMGRRPGSMRTNERPFDPQNAPKDGYWSPFDRPDPRWEDLYLEVDDDDERTRALLWALDLLVEELSEKKLEAIQAWMREGKLKAAGESIGRTEGWICRCVREAEELLRERRSEVLAVNA